VPIETWNAGPEYDNVIKARLKAVLLELDYRPSNTWWGVGGSQEISHWEFTGALGNLTVEAETYIGLTITGPTAAVREVRARMASQAVQSR
jgi:hypothetical protein